MRKRPSRPNRFAAVDNHPIDTLPSILAVGLLTRLIRSKDGDDVTVESLSADYDEGEKALSKAMRMLVADAYVVKFKIQRAVSEVVVEGGVEVLKRGGSWYTTFSVDSVAFTAADVAAMLEAIYAEGNVKAHRVEPTHLDPRNRATQAPRPTPPFGGVGATCGNEVKPQVRPTPPSPGVGQGGAHIRKKTTSAGDDETGDVPSARSAGGVRSTSSSGSSSAEGGSGFAAAGKEGSASDEEAMQPPVPEQRHEGPEVSREQLAAVRAVEAVLPSVLLAAMPYEQFPKRNRQAVLAALESRTVEQIRERVERRWLAYGYEPALYDGHLTSPVGAALELLAPPRYCPDPSCEDGRMIDTGAECAACLQRRALRRAARAEGRLVENGSSKGGSRPRRECVICQSPFPGAVPDGGECRRCQAEAAAAGAALDAFLTSSGIDGQVCEPAVADASPEGSEKEPVVDEETVRIRAELAAQYGTPEQREAYCAHAPF